jgi:hypothetical protein
VVTVGFTTMVAPVAPVLQVTVPSQPLALNVSDSPAQILSLPQVTIGEAGFGETVMIWVAFPLQLFTEQVAS